MTEAIAMLMDKLRFDVHWIEATTGRPAADRNELAAETREAYRLEVLLMARWVPVMTRFERALYADPDRDDLDDLWWDLVEEHQLVPRPEGRHAPDWAAKIHLTVAPVYYHNYLLGELIAAQLRAAIARDALEGESPDGYYGRREVGAFLRRRIFEPGARWHWQEHLRRATGSRLTLHAFTAEFLAPNDRNERADPPSRPAT
jgi:peptidyl-dipeptidase A